MDQSPYKPGVVENVSDLGRPAPSRTPGMPPSDDAPPARIPKWGIAIGVIVVVLVTVSLIMSNGGSATPGTSSPPASATASSH